MQMEFYSFDTKILGILNVTVPIHYTTNLNYIFGMKIPYFLFVNIQPIKIVLQLLNNFLSYRSCFYCSRKTDHCSNSTTYERIRNK